MAMGLHSVGHDWCDLAAAEAYSHYVFFIHYPCYTVISLYGMLGFRPLKLMEYIYKHVFLPIAVML